MMSIVDDFRKYPRVEYEMTLQQPTSWAEKLASLSGEKIAIDPLAMRGKYLTVVVAIPSHAKPNESLAKLRKSRAIKSYTELQRLEENSLFQVEVDAGNTVLAKMADNAFELVSSVIASGERETYRFATLDVSHAEERLATLLNEIKRSLHVTIQEYKVKKVEPTPILEDVTWDDKDRDLIKELVKADYFNPKKAGRPTQDDLASKLGISVGKVNQMLRQLEYTSFQNFLALKPDLAEFRALLKEIRTKERDGKSQPSMPAVVQRYVKP